MPFIRLLRAVVLETFALERDLNRRHRFLGS
ncbi:MAG: hypothetical protein JWR86_3153 [Enterovirga sp.]|nr:hypothetical protein [Enterovirga sp.]